MNTPHSQHRLPRIPGPATLCRLATEEDGAAYTLSYVMVIPVYAILICMIIETVTMLTVKLGTVYSAFSAARTASVWGSATTWDKALVKAQSAAMMSMIPFASGTHGGSESATSADAIAYINAYHEYGKGSISDKFLRSKISFAKEHVKVEIKGPPKSSFDDITAKVTYDFPFNVPGIGHLFGHRGPDGKFYFTITSTAVLANEGPQDDRKTIGIGYGTLE